MKRTKRQENAIVINFILYFILFISFLFLFINYIKPNISEIETTKSETNDIFEKITNIEKKGIGFGDFQSLSEEKNLKKYFEGDKDFNLEYIYGIVSGLKANFYNKNFKNNTNSKYEDFLKKLAEAQKEDTNTEERLLVLSKILPSYSENIYEIDGENSLTDFKFINYIETIFNSFDLSYDNSIGIQNLTILPNYVIGIGDTSLDTNIFYIPLEFNIEGSKLSIINFLHFVENVGRISLEKPLGNDGKIDETQPSELIIYDEKYKLGDDFYSFRNIKLSRNPKDENIFNNQIFSIESISFDDYINSTFDISDLSSKKDISFIKFLENTNQFPEKFNIRVKLRFYVKGQPKYKIEKFITDFKSSFNETKKDLAKILSKSDLSSSDKTKLENIKTTIDSLSSSVKNLNSKDKDLTEIYNEAYKYNSFLDEQIGKINKIKEKIGNIEK